jgi:hypothetical protein
MNARCINLLLTAIFGENKEFMGLEESKFSPAWHTLSGTHSLESVMNKLLGTLTPREERVIRLRFGLDNGTPLTFKKVGKEFNVTGYRISQIEGKALRRLRYPTRKRKLKPFRPTSLDIRIALARKDLYFKLVKIYPPKVAYTVASQVKVRDFQVAFRSTESALKSSCGNILSYCLSCGKPLPPGWTLCDKECEAKYKTLTLVCTTCGNEFQRKERLLFRKKNGERLGMQAVFCNKDCLYHRPKGIFMYHRKGKIIVS